MGIGWKNATGSGRDFPGGDSVSTSGTRVRRARRRSGSFWRRLKLDHQTGVRHPLRIVIPTRKLRGLKMKMWRETRLGWIPLSLILMKKLRRSGENKLRIRKKKLIQLRLVLSEK